MAYSLTKINEAVRSDPKGFAQECDAVYAGRLNNAADKIAENGKKSHVILLAGPSGSGKTTTAKRIEEILNRKGVQIHTISMDNYFRTIDPETAPRTRDGQIDYGSPACMDVELLGRHFQRLDRGETIHVPKYEFALQMRTDILAQPLKVGENELVVFEGIHAMNDVIVDKDPDAFKLYIAARSTVLDDNGEVAFPHAWLRLCRRIVREHEALGNDALFTLKMWEKVRRGEKFHISPYKENANLMIDTSLAFEVCALKPLVVPLLEEIQTKCDLVHGMLRAFDKFEAMDASCVAGDSLLREFIGGGTQGA